MSLRFSQENAKSNSHFPSLETMVGRITKKTSEMVIVPWQKIKHHRFSRKKPKLPCFSCSMDLVGLDDYWWEPTTQQT